LQRDNQCANKEEVAKNPIARNQQHPEGFTPLKTKTQRSRPSP
jgi:hypothetical protein